MRFPKQYLAVGWMAALCAALHAQEHPDLGRIADYPVASQVWLGSLVGVVSVNPEFPVEVSVPGKFLWKVADGQQVSEGEVIGIAGADKLELAERELELKKSRYGNSIVDLELAGSEKRQALVKVVSDLEGKLTKMSLTEGERALLGAEFAERLSKERASLETEIKRSRDKLESDYFELAEAADRKALDLEIERAKLDLQDLLRSSEVLAPVAGKVVIEFHDSIRKTTQIGKVIKDGLAEARLEVAEIHLRNVPGEELVIEFNGEDGRTYRGGYLRLLERRSLDQNAKIMVFDIRNQNEGEPVPVALDGSRMIRVYRILAKSGRIVPKKDLVFKFPKEIDSEGWAVFIEKRWPGVKVTYVGPREIVVNPADEN